MPNRAFIVGCARSGTSILGELVASHPAVDYVFEAHPIWELGGEGVNGSHRLLASHATESVRRAARERFAEQGTGRPWLVEKNPRNALRVPYVKALFPDARLIHIVRDGRDVACSMMPGIGGEAWAHLKPPNWQRWRDEFAGTERCARVWKEVLEIALEDLEAVDHLQVRYEDLVADPRVQAVRILRYLDLDIDPAVETFLAKISNTTRDSYHAARQVHWARGEHAFRVGRWRENTSPDEQARISKLLRPMLERLGYEAATFAPVNGPWTAMAERASNDVLLTGLARSGTTLTVSLLNRLPGTIALHEPMDFDRYPLTRESALNDIADYLRRTRVELLQTGATVTRVVQSKEQSNPYSDQRRDGRLRAEISPVQRHQFNKPLRDDFLLVVKHPLAFTALLDRLTGSYPVFALVRNPLSVLASWNSVEAPVASGRAPQAEKRDPELKRALDDEPDLLSRQLILLDWVCDRYERLLPPHAVIRYETVVATEGRALDVVTREARCLSEPLRAKNANALYDRSRIESWAAALDRRQGAWLAFYSQRQIDEVREEILAAPAPNRAVT